MKSSWLVFHFESTPSSRLAYHDGCGQNKTFSITWAERNLKSSGKMIEWVISKIMLEKVEKNVISRTRNVEDQRWLSFKSFLFSLQNLHSLSYVSQNDHKVPGCSLQPSMLHLSAAQPFLGRAKERSEDKNGEKQHHEAECERWFISSAGDVNPGTSQECFSRACKKRKRKKKEPGGVIYGSGCGRVNEAGRVENFHLGCI